MMRQAGRRAWRLIFWHWCAHRAKRCPSSCKAAVIHCTRTQAAALATQGIRVNCVAPGSIEFPGGIGEQRKRDDPALYRSIQAPMPAKRLGHPEEVANVVLFLASPLASWVTAQIIDVNGGQGFVR
jgi:3-oxoacyl-[acyl-carrier protein] reductase